MLDCHLDYDDDDVRPEPECSNCDELHETIEGLEEEIEKLNAYINELETEIVDLKTALAPVRALLKAIADKKLDVDEGLLMLWNRLGIKYSDKLKR